MNIDDIQAVIDQHNAALGSLRAASIAFDRAIAGMRTVLDAIAEASHQQGAAIDGVIAANQAVLRLLRRERGNA